MGQTKSQAVFNRFVLFECLGLWTTTLLLGCGEPRHAEVAFEEFFNEKQRLVVKFLEDEPYDLLGLKATRETHSTGGVPEGTIRFTAKSRDGKELSATYHYAWQDGNWILKSSETAKITGRGSSVDLPKLDQLME